MTIGHTDVYKDERGTYHVRRYDHRNRLISERVTAHRHLAVEAATEAKVQEADRAYEQAVVIRLRSGAAEAVRLWDERIRELTEQQSQPEETHQP